MVAILFNHTDDEAGVPYDEFENPTTIISERNARNPDTFSNHGVDNAWAGSKVLEAGCALTSGVGTNGTQTNYVATEHFVQTNYINTKPLSPTTSDAADSNDTKALSIRSLQAPTNDVVKKFKIGRVSTTQSPCDDIGMTNTVQSICFSSPIALLIIIQATLVLFGYCILATPDFNIQKEIELAPIKTSDPTKFHSPPLHPGQLRIQSSQARNLRSRQALAPQHRELPLHS